MEIEDVKIAVMGNVNTSKSSTIGTLLRGVKDNGRGLNRSIVMNYKHEKDTGRTSSVGYQILGFRQDESLIRISNKNKKDTWPKIMREASKLISFMDLAGHEKYLKTTIHGLSSNHPDYALILTEGKGVRGMTREHIMLSLSFNVPFIILITKIDLYSKESVNATIEAIRKILKGAKKEIWIVHDTIDLKIPLQGGFVPVFAISNVSGEGIDLFEKYLYQLPKRIDYTTSHDDPFELAVLEGFIVPGIGTVAHGFLVRGTAHVGDQVWIGPDSAGNYQKAKIRSIQFKRINVEFALPGHHICLSLPGISRGILNHGVYVLHEKVKERSAIRRFDADIKVLSTHTITIKKGYSPILNISNIRMTARVVEIRVDSDDKSIEQEFIRGGSRAWIKFEFVYRPAYLRPGATFVFREGKTRGYGKVLQVYS